METNELVKVVTFRYVEICLLFTWAFFVLCIAIFAIVCSFLDYFQWYYDIIST